MHVRVRERVENLTHDVTHPLHLAAQALLQIRSERFARHVFHRDPGIVRLVAVLVHLNDIGVDQLGGRLCLAFETFHRF